MSKQHKVTAPQKLLDEKGSIKEPGYSTSLIWEYKRNDIKANKFRIKEWDYYYVGNSNHAIALTIADNSYMALVSLTLFDFIRKTEITKTLMQPFSMGKLNLPDTSKEGVTAFKNKRVNMKFANDGKERKLTCTFKNFTKGNDLNAEITLTEEPEDTMVIATPFAKDDKAFYYNQKINCMKASGTVTHGETVYEFNTPDSMGTLDWGRGVWTYKNTWYWGSMSVRLPDGAPFGFNIGYGFGDTSAATENMVFYKGKAHKLDEVKFNIPTIDGKDDYMSPWTFTSNDKRFELTFEPVIDRYAYANLLVLKTIQHQVFGKFSGKVILDDGKVIELKDAMGFAEKVFNKY